MHAFTIEKTQWSIEINIGTIKRVLASASINLSLPHEPDADGRTLAQRLLGDTIQMVDVIWALLEPQATKAGLSMDQFFELCKPEVMKMAEEAFIAEWKDFFQKLGRPAIAEVITLAQKMINETRDTALTELQRLHAAQIAAMKLEMKTEVDRALTLFETATNGPSSDSATASPADSTSAMSIDARGAS